MSSSVATQGGLYEPKASLSANGYSLFYKSFFASNVLYAVSITAAKLSVLLLYRRIFTVRRFRIVIDIVGVLSLLWGITSFLIFIFQCNPVHKGFNPDAPGQCINLESTYYGISVSNAAFDVLITFMPVKLIWALKLPMKQRVVLILIMCLGLMCVPVPKSPSCLKPKS